MWIPSLCSLSTFAPSLRRVSRWKSIGRPPMLQPPSAGMNASPKRCSSGPENRIGIRDEPDSVSTSATSASCTLAASIVTTPLSPSTVTSTPCRRSKSDTTCTSRISGTFFSTEVPGASNAATMALLTKFFAPRTLMVPFSGLPPSTCRMSFLLSDTLNLFRFPLDQAQKHCCLVCHKACSMFAKNGIQRSVSLISRARFASHMAPVALITAFAPASRYAL